MALSIDDIFCRLYLPMAYNLHAILKVTPPGGTW